jgi:hypothetical protein
LAQHFSNLTPVHPTYHAVGFARTVNPILAIHPMGRSRAASGRSEMHIPGMATIVQCNCGAEYRRTEEKFLVPHTGDAVCTVCGAALESWRESTHVPTYELIERPERKPE